MEVSNAIGSSLIVLLCGWKMQHMIIISLMWDVVGDLELGQGHQLLRDSIVSLLLRLSGMVMYVSLI